MKRLLSSAVAFVLIGSSSGAGPEEDRAPRVPPDPGNVEKPLNEREAKARANYEAFVRRALSRVPHFVVPPDVHPRVAPAPYPLDPFSYDVFVPNPRTATIGPGRFDRCLITVDPAAFDSHFVVKMPEVNSRMIVAPSVRGLPAGSWPYGTSQP